VARAPRVPTVRSASAVHLRVNAANSPRGDERVYKISALLPGIDSKDIDVSVSGDTLRPRRLVPTFVPAAVYVDRDRVAADVSKGVLTITLPKTAEAQRPQKKTEIKSA
jgi:HSP20 family protein